MPIPPVDLDIYQHPLTPTSYPHLQIEGTVCTQHLQHTLCDVATNQTYFEYLSGKFSGITQPAKDIHWHLFRHSIKWFKSTDRRTIVKFIHDWLPLLDRHHTQSMSQDNRCPSCRQATETIDHFLECQHAACLQVWKDLHEQLHQHQVRNSISNIFHDLLAYGLYTGCKEPVC